MQGPSSPSAHPTWVDLHGLCDDNAPNRLLNVSDIQHMAMGMQGHTYENSLDRKSPGECTDAQCESGGGPFVRGNSLLTLDIAAP
jgi:hypothetical protein